MRESAAPPALDPRRSSVPRPDGRGYFLPVLRTWPPPGRCGPGAAIAPSARREAPAVRSHARERVVTDGKENRGPEGRHTHIA